MSGPTIIDYRAVERRRAEAARRRWRSLSGRAQALSDRCAAAGHMECAVRVGQPRGSSSKDMESDCDALERQIATAERDLEESQLGDRTRQVVANLADVLAALERREHAATSAAAPEHRTEVATDFATKVSHLLASMKTPSAEFEQLGKDVLAAGDPARARMLYDYLGDRISEANRTADAAIERRTEIAELRAQLDGLPDPAPVAALLDHATALVERCEDAQAHLKQARGAITRQQDELQAASDREFVQHAVADSLSELGYDVADVDVETAETLVFRQSQTHGIRAQIHDGEIDLRTVRLGSDANRAADRDAEEEFCRRLPDFLSAMSRRGLPSAVKEQKLPGLIAPETVPLRARRTKSSTQPDQQQAPAARKRTAR